MVKLDKDEFNEMIFTRINNLIDDYELIKEGELIAVALSGGKDSVLTLHALKNYQQFLDFDLVAISVDEGIEGYRQHGIDSAVQNAKDLGVELVQKSFKEEISGQLTSPLIFERSIYFRIGIIYSRESVIEHLIHLWYYQLHFIKECNWY